MFSDSERCSLSATAILTCRCTGSAGVSPTLDPVSQSADPVGAEGQRLLRTLRVDGRPGGTAYAGRRNREPLHARTHVAGACRKGYVGLATGAAELQPWKPRGEYCASGKLRSAHSVIGRQPQDQSSPGTRRPRLPKRFDKRRRVLCRSATCRANIFVTITNGQPQG